MEKTKLEKEYAKEELKKREIEKGKNVYLTLFLSTFTLSAFTFGGGYVIVPLMKKKFVEDLKWIEEEEILNLIAIAQSSPGAIAINSSFLIGYKIAGVKGAFITILGSALPPLIILTIVSFFYTAFKTNRVIQAVLQGMQAGVSAMIADVVINLGSNIVKERSLFSMIIMIGAFVVTFFLRINVVYTILFCGLIGFLRVMTNKKSGDNK